MSRVIPSASVVALVVFVACGSNSGMSCEDPPAGQSESPAGVTLTVTPNPPEAGSEAELSIRGEGLPSDAIVGAAVLWQCWDGTAWTDTHHMLRGTYGDYRTRALEPGVTVTVPAVGIPLPNSFSILIPEVPAGTYRIVDSVWVDGRKELTVLVIVQVT